MERSAVAVRNLQEEDETLDVVRSTSVHCIDFPINLGVASALQSGFRFALRHGFNMVVQFDGDGQHIAGEIVKIAGPVQNGECDIAVGSREQDKEATSSTARRLGSRIISTFLKAFTRQDFKDPTSGFRAYSSEAVERFASDFPDEYPEVESIILAKKYGLTVIEVPVSMRPRMGGQSSISFYGSWYYMIKVFLASVVMMLRKY